MMGRFSRRFSRHAEAIEVDDLLRGLGLDEVERDEVFALAGTARVDPRVVVSLVAAGVSSGDIPRVLRAVKELSGASGLHINDSAQVLCRVIAQGYLS